MSTRKKFTPEFKAKVVLEIFKEEKSLSQISSEYEVHPTQLKKWKKEARQNLAQLFVDDHKGINKLKKDYEEKLNDLYAEVGKRTTQLSWLKKKSGLSAD